MWSQFVKKGNEIIIHNSMDNNVFFMVNVVLCFKIVFVFCNYFSKKNHQIHSYHSQTKISKLSHLLLFNFFIMFSIYFQYSLIVVSLSIIEFASFNQDFPFINNANKLYMFLSFRSLILYKVLLSFINLSFLELTIFCWSA